MKGYRWTIHAQNAHVLHEDGIDTGIPEVGQQPTGVVELIVVDYGIDRDVDFGPKLMGIAAQLADVIDAVACCHTGTKTAGTDVDGVGPVVDGSNATLQVLGRCQQFKPTQSC